MYIIKINKILTLLPIKYDQLISKSLQKKMPDY